MGNEVDDDGNSVTGDDDDDDDDDDGDDNSPMGSGLMGYYNDNDGNGRRLRQQ